MLEVIIFSFLGGILVYVATAAVLGKEKTNNLPGGAFGFGIFIALITKTPLYIAPIIAVAAHYLTAFLAKKYFKKSY